MSAGILYKMVSKGGERKKENVCEIGKRGDIMRLAIYDPQFTDSTWY